MYLTELVANKLPIHIAAQHAGHRSLNTTMGYVAIYPQDVFDHYDQFLERRRAVRPGDEYREPATEELQLFADHFGRRQVELGDCVRPYGSGCTHEHACIRCDFLSVHPDASQRLDEIKDDLGRRINNAQEQRGNGITDRGSLYGLSMGLAGWSPGEAVRMLRRAAMSIFTSP